MTKIHLIDISDPKTFKECQSGSCQMCNYHHHGQQAKDCKHRKELKEKEGIYWDEDDFEWKSRQGFIMRDRRT